MTTVTARPLPPGGTIGVAGTSSPWEQRSDVDRGLRWWESQGYRVKLAPGVYDRDAYLAGDPETRAKDLMAMFADPEVDVVQSLGGGFGAWQVVPLLDLGVVAANPKPFVGYSDVTALHLAIRKATGLVTFYGPGFMGVGDAQRGEFSRDSVLRALTTTEPLGEVPARPDDPYVGAMNGGIASGPLVGGCLTLVRDSLGTPWEVDLDGAILFFEDIYLPSSEADAALTHLANAGKLDRVRGVVIGEMAKCQDELFPGRWLQSRSMEDVFEAHFRPRGIPVVFNLPIGHGKHLWTAPLGLAATVDADARTVTFTEPALAPGPDTSG